MSDGGKAAWYRDGLGHFEEIAARLRNVVIEHRDVFEVIARFDSPTTLFYLDPPYNAEARASTGQYLYEFSDEQHFRLASVLRLAKGYVAVSGYSSALTDRLYAGWTRTDKEVVATSSTKATRRIESLWTNYEPGTWKRTVTEASAPIETMENTW